MAELNGLLGPLDNASLAAISTSAIRPLVQAQVTATTVASTTYTVTSPNCRRVLCCHASAGAGDITVNVNAAASAAHLPVYPQRYVVVYATVGETVRFYNSTGGSVTVNVVEMP